MKHARRLPRTYPRRQKGVGVNGTAAHQIHGCSYSCRAKEGDRKQGGDNMHLSPTVNAVLPVCKGGWQQVFCKLLTVDLG